MRKRIHVDRQTENKWNMPVVKMEGEGENRYTYLLPGLLWFVYFMTDKKGPTCPSFVSSRFSRLRGREAAITA